MVVLPKYYFHKITWEESIIVKCKERFIIKYSPFHWRNYLSLWLLLKLPTSLVCQFSLTCSIHFQNLRGKYILNISLYIHIYVDDTTWDEFLCWYCPWSGERCKSVRRKIYLQDILCVIKSLHRENWLKMQYLFPEIKYHLVPGYLLVPKPDTKL